MKKIMRQTLPQQVLFYKPIQQFESVFPTCVYFIMYQDHQPVYSGVFT